MIDRVRITTDTGVSRNLYLADPYNGTKESTLGLPVYSIEGLAPVQASLNFVDIADYDGGRFTNAHQSTRNIVIELKIDEMLYKNMSEARHELYRIFPIKRNVTLDFYVDGEEEIFLTTDGYVESCDTAYFGQNETAQISIICGDPNFYYGHDLITDNDKKYVKIKRLWNETIKKEALEHWFYGSIITTIPSNKKINSIGSITKNASNEFEMLEKNTQGLLELKKIEPFDTNPTEHGVFYYTLPINVKSNKCLVIYNNLDYEPLIDIGLFVDYIHTNLGQVNKPKIYVKQFLSDSMFVDQGVKKVNYNKAYKGLDIECPNEIDLISSPSNSSFVFFDAINKEIFLDNGVKKVNLKIYTGYKKYIENFSNGIGPWFYLKNGFNAFYFEMYGIRTYSDLEIDLLSTSLNGDYVNDIVIGINKFETGL